jgi:hypothetical protein
MIKNFNLETKINQRQSDFLFVASSTLLTLLFIVQYIFPWQTIDPKPLPPWRVLTDILGSISVYGMFFFLFSAPLALVKAENRPPNYGGNVFGAFLMYLYLPLTIYWLRKRHMALNSTLNTEAGNIL